MWRKDPEGKLCCNACSLYCSSFSLSFLPFSSTKLTKLLPTRRQAPQGRTTSVAGAETQSSSSGESKPRRRRCRNLRRIEGRSFVFLHSSHSRPQHHDRHLRYRHPDVSTSTSALPNPVPLPPSLPTNLPTPPGTPSTTSLRPSRRRRPTRFAPPAPASVATGWDARLSSSFPSAPSSSRSKRRSPAALPASPATLPATTRLPATATTATPIATTTSAAAASTAAEVYPPASYSRSPPSFTVRADGVGRSRLWDRLGSSSGGGGWTSRIVDAGRGRVVDPSSTSKPAVFFVDSGAAAVNYVACIPFPSSPVPPYRPTPPPLHPPLPSSRE
jgi:hypothetical protein